MSAPDGSVPVRCLCCGVVLRYAPVRRGVPPPFCAVCAAKPAATHPAWFRPPYCGPVLTTGLRR